VFGLETFKGASFYLFRLDIVIRGQQ